jgi:CHAT domain-containing protein/Tfp pilus assembly protein PilF
LWQELGDREEEARANFNLGTNLEPDDPMAAMSNYRRALALWRDSGNRASEALALNFIGLVHQAAGHVQQAIESYEASRSIRRELGDTYYEAQAAHNIGQMYRKQGNPRLALETFQQALDVLQGTADLRQPPRLLQSAESIEALERHFSETGNLRLSITVLDGIALIYDTLGDALQAIDFWENAIFLARLADAEAELARIHNNVGAFYSKIGGLQEALDHYQLALRFFASERGNRYWEGWTRNNIGQLYSRLGEPDRALDYLNQALSLRTRVGDVSGQSQTLTSLGQVYSQTGDPESAVANFSQSLELREEAPDPRQHGATLDLLGLAYRSMGEFSMALARHELAAALLHDAEATREEAAAISNQGRALLAMGDSESALARFATALDLHRKMRDPSLEAQTRYEISRARRAMGQSLESLLQLDTAMAIIESLRADLIAPSLRASFLATQLDVFTFYIDTLMDVGMRDDAPEYKARALAAAERARSRSLLDYVSSSTIVQSTVAPELLVKRKELRQQLNAKEELRLALAGKTEHSLEIEEIERETRELTGQLEVIDTEVRRNQAADLDQDATIATLVDVQSLLEPNEVLLEYAIGPDRGFVWAIDSDTFQTTLLPGAGELEEMVREGFNELRKPATDPVSRRKILDRLARILLSPVVAFPGDRRLIFVPDGALHYVPFGALPDPAVPAEPLIANHEIVVLPSASTLLALRQRAQRVQPEERRVAILADPVFELRDARLGPNASLESKASLVEFDPDLKRSATDLGWNGFRRLPATRLEAEAIRQFVQDDRILMLLDFDANREQVLSGALNDYQILHFATHGIVNAAHPGLSGLVLSGFNINGQPQSAFLRAHDLYFTKLGADLVVLSACETALGREIRGEGLMGLTRGFFYAGANTVISSLWQVPDRATGELMRHFYGELLKNGRSPAAALRLAQLRIRDERRWRDPYYWAAFVVQGDWR